MANVASLPRTANAHHVPSAAELRSTTLLVRGGASLTDLLFVAAVVVPIGHLSGLGAVAQIFLFYAVRAVYEIGFVAATGRTPGRVLFRLFVSRDAEWSRRPGLGRSIVRHVVKSGDGVFLILVGAIALAAAVGGPTSSWTYFLLVLAIPLAVVANVVYLLTPVTMLSSIASSDEHRGLHDRAAGTWVLDTTGFVDSTPTVRGYRRA